MKAIINETTSLWAKIVAMCGKLILTIWAFISPIQVVLMAVGMFIISDTVLGIWKAKKIGETISSKRMADVIRKMLVYQLVVITFYFIDFAVIHDIVFEIVNIHYALTKAVALVLISIEFFSMDESFKAATGKGLLDRLTEIVQKYKDVKGGSPDKPIVNEQDN